MVADILGDNGLVATNQFNALDVAGLDVEEATALTMDVFGLLELVVIPNYEAPNGKNAKNEEQGGA